MKAFISKLTLGIFVILFLGVTVHIMANAGSQCYPSSSNCLTQAEYIHTVTNDNSTYWSAGVSSRTNNPVRTMDDIGYSYWTTRQYCSGVIKKQNQMSGNVLHYKSNYWASATYAKVTCSNPNGREGESLGNHDFYDYPYSHIYPYSADRHIIP